MGWTAGANNLPKDHEFQKIADDIKTKYGLVDAVLSIGGLKCGACARALEEATGMNCYDENGWSIDTVKRLAIEAEWPTDHGEESMWAIISAKAFLEQCAALQTSISFSY